ATRARSWHLRRTRRAARSRTRCASLTRPGRGAGGAALEDDGTTSPTVTVPASLASMPHRHGDGPVLRITETAESAPGRYRVEVALEGVGPRIRATSAFELAISAQDREDLRWYLEDYLLFPFDPAPTIAKRIVARMAEIGETLCRGVFLG